MVPMSLNDAYDREPLFQLFGRDPLAPAVVRYWATLAAETGLTGAPLDWAERVAREMEAYQARANPD